MEEAVDIEGDHLLKVCEVCKEMYKPAYAKHNHQKYCSKECHNNYRRKKYGENKDQTRGYNLKYKFGITIEEYQRMLDAQDGRCAICRREETVVRRRGTHSNENIVLGLAVDHNHKTKQVRALLCNTCNKGLGSFNDDIPLLETALEYLRKHNDTQVHD